MLVKVKGAIKDLSIEEIYEEMKPFLVSRFSKYPHYLEFEDYMSLAKISFMTTINKYDVRKGTYFITLLGLILDGDLIKYLKRERDRSVKATSLDVQYAENRDAHEMFEDPNVEMDFDKIETKEVVNRCMENLTARERKIIKLYYYNELTQTEIANILGLKQVSISRILQGAKEKMKLELAG